MYPNVSRCILVRGYTGIHRDTRVSQCIRGYPGEGYTGIHVYPNVSRCILVRGYTGIHRDTRVSQCIPVYLSVSLRLPFLSQKNDRYAARPSEQKQLKNVTCASWCISHSLGRQPPKESTNPAQCEHLLTLLVNTIFLHRTYKSSKNKHKKITSVTCF